MSSPVETDINKEISKCFKLFRNQDLRVWEYFSSLMEHRVRSVTVAVTDAPPDQILVAQGMAKEARKMLQLMTELPADE